jgi:hypothetical protein
MPISRRHVIQGLVGVSAVFAWPVCRLEDRHDRRRQSGWLAKLPVGRLSALKAAVERILPGSIAAGALVFIDYWLQQPTIKNLQHTFDLGAMFLNRVARSRYRKAFADCTGVEQDDVLRAFSRGEVHPKFDSKKYWELLVTFTLESYLGDPIYGGNRERVGWQLIGWQPCWWSPKRVGHLVARDPRLPY